MILAAAASAPAIVTALGGVGVSLTTVFFNSRRQNIETGRNASHIEALTTQIAVLSTQIAALQGENAALKTEVRLLREHLSDQPPPAAKKKAKK